jgi:hypothetical protein
MQMYRREVIGVQAIGHVLRAYDEPPMTGATVPRGGCSMPPRSRLRAR